MYIVGVEWKFLNLTNCEASTDLMKLRGSMSPDNETVLLRVNLIMLSIQGDGMIRGIIRTVTCKVKTI